MKRGCIRNMSGYDKTASETENFDKMAETFCVE